MLMQKLPLIFDLRLKIEIRGSSKGKKTSSLIKLYGILPTHYNRQKTK